MSKFVKLPWSEVIIPTETIVRIVPFYSDYDNRFGVHLTDGICYQEKYGRSGSDMKHDLAKLLEELNS